MRLHTFTTPQIALHEAGHLAVAVTLTFSGKPLEASATMRKGVCGTVRAKGRTRHRYKRRLPPTSSSACVNWALSMAPSCVNGAMPPGRSDRRSARRVQRFLPCKSAAVIALKNLMDDGYVRFFVARMAMLLQTNGLATSADILALARDAGLTGRKHYDLLMKFHSDCTQTKEA